MCAIVDANVQRDVFGPLRPEAGAKFFEWINSGIGRLVVGGHLLEELNRTPAREWLRQALIAGKATRVTDSKVEQRTEELQNERSYKSDDPHIIALAQISGARLLYTNEWKLLEDFGNKTLIDNPRGKVFSTHCKQNPDKKFTSTHKKLLRRKDLCETG